MEKWRVCRNYRLQQAVLPSALIWNRDNTGPALFSYSRKKIFQKDQKFLIRKFLLIQESFWFMKVYIERGVFHTEFSIITAPLWWPCRSWSLRCGVELSHLGQIRYIMIYYYYTPPSCSSPAVRCETLCRIRIVRIQTQQTYATSFLFYVLLVDYTGATQQHELDHVMQDRDRPALSGRI